jgi:hypothetical protein
MASNIFSFAKKFFENNIFPVWIDNNAFAVLQPQ